MRLSIILLLTSLSLITSQRKGIQHPVIIFPGLLSNSLWQDEQKPGTCFKEPRLWYSAKSTLFTDECWARAMSLGYDKNTNMVLDSTPLIWHNFGAVDSIFDIGEKIYPGRGPQIYKNMIEHLERFGLKRNYTIRAIQMDWRKSVTDFSPDYYNAVRSEFTGLVNKTWSRVTVICHSYGCLNLAQFILKSNHTEVSSYIHKIITLGAPWRGSTKSVKGLLSGDNLDIKVNWNWALSRVMRTFTSLVHLIPDSDLLAEYHPFVVVDGTAYTSIVELLKKFGISPERLNGRQSISTLIHAFAHLDKRIKTYCVYGNITKSVISQIRYQPNRIKYQLEKKADGDGTVPLESLKACEGRLKETKWFAVKHQEMLDDYRVLNYISQNID